MKTFTITFTTQAQQVEAMLAMRTHAEGLQRVHAEYVKSGDYDQAKKYQSYLLAANNAADAIGAATELESLS